jgi:acyl-CoA dehydrogenase
MDLRLTAEDRSLKERARAFTENVLFPLELECEEHDGVLPESFARVKRAVLDEGFNAINHAEQDGGRGYDTCLVIGNELRKRGHEPFTGWPAD